MSRSIESIEKVKIGSGYLLNCLGEVEGWDVDIFIWCLFCDKYALYLLLR